MDDGFVDAWIGGAANPSYKRMNMTRLRQNYGEASDEDDLLETGETPFPLRHCDNIILAGEIRRLIVLELVGATAEMPFVNCLQEFVTGITSMYISHYIV